MRDDERHRLAEYRVDKKHNCDDDQRQADGPPGRFQQENDADPADDRLDGHHNAEHLDGEQDALATDDAVPVHVKVERRRARKERQNQVVPWHPVGGETAGGGKSQVAEQQSEREVDGPRRHVGDDADIEHERKWRCDPHLEQRPGESDQADRERQPRTVLVAGVLDILELAGQASGIILCVIAARTGVRHRPMPLPARSILGYGPARRCLRHDCTLRPKGVAAAV